MFNPIAWYRHRRAMKQFAALLNRYARTPPVYWVGNRAWVAVTSTPRTAASVANLVTPHRFNPRVHKWYVLCSTPSYCEDAAAYLPGEYHASYYTTRAAARAAQRKMRNNPFMQWDSIQVYRC